MTRLSVVIPTFNRADLLGDVLRDLCHQRGTSTDDFEVIVIDDGSTDGTAEVVRRAGSDADPPLRYTHQANAGLNAARNAGFRQSAGEIVAYLDDDVALPPEWVSSVLAAFDEHQAIDAVAGRIILRFDCGTEPPWLAPPLRQYLSELDLGPEPMIISPDEYPRGANFAVRRRAIEAVGPFLDGLDRRGASLLSSGEEEFFLRFHGAGHQTMYWPAAWCWHRVPPERLTPEWFRRRASAQGAGDALIARMEGRRYRVPREVVRLTRVVPILGKSMLNRAGTLNADLWIRYCTSRIAAELRHRQ